MRADARISKTVGLIAACTALLCSSCHSCDSDAGPSATPQTAPRTSSYRPGYISLQIDGTVGAEDVQGIVQSEELTCVVEPQGSIGNLYHVTWSGQLDPGNTPISGEIIGPPGTSVFGTNPVNPPPNKIANANVDVFGTRVGGGLSGGTGTLTMTSATVGSLHATLDSGGGHLSVSGEWDCTAALQ